MRKRTVILIAIFGILGIGLTVYRVFFLRMARVPGSSMANTIIPGDHIVMTKAFGQLERGEIVVFQHDPKGPDLRDARYREDPSTFYVARVVGLPGETIQMRGTTLYINEQPLPEQKVTSREVDYLDPLEELSTDGNGPYRVFYSQSADERSTISDNFIFAGQTPFQIPKDSYFIMGDNRDNSEDSRFRGPVPRELIWGKAVMVYYSASERTYEARWDRVFKRIQ